VLEVTLRTPAAPGAIRAMKRVEGAIVGAGTVLNARQFEQAVEAGSQFVVSPGFTAAVGEAAAGSHVPLLPGVANAGDVMRVLEFGITRMKFFPAMASGGGAGAEGVQFRVRRRPLLPDRRDLAGECARMACSSRGGVRGRDLAGARRAGG
jgi:Entner-Doudoroff aldolase